MKSRNENDAVFLYFLGEWGWGWGVGSINFPKSSRVSPVRPSVRIAAVQVSMKRKTAGIFSLFYE